MASAPNRPEYYFDIPSGSVLLGKVAVRNFLKDNPDSLQPAHLSEVLLEDGHSLPEEGYPRLEVAGWEKKDYLKYGRWINKLVSSQDNPSRLNESVLGRASYLGLGPSVKQIGRVFGSTGAFYAEIGAANAHRINTFDGWSQEDYISYIAKVGEEMGKRPTHEKLWELSRQDPRCPSPIVISKFFGNGKGSIGTAVELAGYPDIYRWNHDDYIDWGVKFMRANNGDLPNSRKVSYFSKQGRGPSDRVIMNKFGLFSAYQEEVDERYLSVVGEAQARQQARLIEIDAMASAGTLPAELLTPIVVDEERIRSTAQFLVFDELVGDYATVERKIRIGQSEDGSSFVSAVRRRHPHITAGDIESTALYLGVYDDIWPLDQFMRQLKLPLELSRPTQRRRSPQRITT